MTRGWLALHSHEMGQSRQVALGRRVQSVEGRAALKLGRQEFWGALRGAPVLRGCGLKLGPLFFFFFCWTLCRTPGRFLGWLGRMRICTGLAASWAGKGTWDRTGDRHPAQGGRAGTGEWEVQARSMRTAVPSSAGEGPGGQPQSSWEK